MQLPSSTVARREACSARPSATAGPVVGTGGGSADDWIAARIPELAAEGRRVWLVSSDRGLRERVTGSVERTIGGGSFAGTLEELGD